MLSVNRVTFYALALRRELLAVCSGDPLKETSINDDDSTAPRSAPAGPSRRDAIRWLGTALAAAPLASVLGCDTDTNEDEDSDAASPNDAAAGGDARASGATVSTADGGSSSDAASATRDGAVATGWASGGTAAMTALATYPNPFAAITSRSCIPTCAMTLGPCHDDLAPEREDISEGQAGLPLRFGLRIVDDSCQPVTDADVDIWHCDVLGIYSSETADSPSFCTGTDAVALAARWFRGHRKTDANGMAWFSTCFPGWYSGRAIHIHFTVRRSSQEGDEYLTSQVAFPAALDTEICSSHPSYSSHGLPDTTNTTDSVFPSATVDQHVVETQRMTDGAMLAWKTIIIRSSLSTSVCSASGMMDGPPGR